MVRVPLVVPKRCLRGTRHEIYFFINLFKGVCYQINCNMCTIEKNALIPIRDLKLMYVYLHCTCYVKLGLRDKWHWYNWDFANVYKVWESYQNYYYICRSVWRYTRDYILNFKWNIRAEYENKVLEIFFNDRSLLR